MLSFGYGGCPSEGRGPGQRMMRVHDGALAMGWDRGDSAGREEGTGFGCACDWVVEVGGGRVHGNDLVEAQ